MGVIGGIVAGIASFLGASGAVASAIGTAVNLGLAAFSIASSMGTAKAQRHGSSLALPKNTSLMHPNPTLAIDDTAPLDRSVQLQSFLAATWGRPYHLGQWDCVLFIAAWVDLLTGSNHIAEIGNTYSTENAGRHLHAPLGYTKAIRETLIPTGWKQVSAPFQVGDIILTDLAHPGIWDGERIIAQPAQAFGLLVLHESHARSGIRFPSVAP